MSRLCVDVSCGLCIVAGGCFAGMWGVKVDDICLLGFLYLVCAVVYWLCCGLVAWIVMLYRDSGMNENKEMLLWGVC